MAVVQSNGVPALIHSLVQGQGKEEILEPAICALRHITCRHSHASEAQDAVRQASGLPLIVDLLNANLYSWPLVKSTISLIRNLALSTSNLPVLREIGAIPKLAQLLVRTHQELQKQPSASNGPLIDNYIRMDDVLEACVSAIHMIAKDQQNRNLLRDLDCIPLFVRVRFVDLSGGKKHPRFVRSLVTLSAVESVDSTSRGRRSVRIGQRSSLREHHRTGELYAETNRSAQIDGRRRW